MPGLSLPSAANVSAYSAVISAVTSGKTRITDIDVVGIDPIPFLLKIRF